MLTRRDVVTGRDRPALATTAPWWLVRRAHAAREAKLVVWITTALAPQVDKIMQEQCYAYAKQAGLKENEIDYAVMGAGQLHPKLVAALEGGNPPDIAESAWQRPALSFPGPPAGGYRPGQHHAATAGGLLPVSLSEGDVAGQSLQLPAVRQSLAPGHPPGRPGGGQSQSSRTPGTNSSRSARSSKSRRG